MTGIPTRRAALLLGLGGALSGCGFQPVYLSSGKGEEPAVDMAAVNVNPMYERPGQILREALIARLNSNSGDAHHYDLQVNFWVTGEGQAVLNFTQPTRVRLTGYANWALSARDKQKTKLVNGSERVMDGFDIFDTQLFAVDLDNEHVQRRIAEAIADRIKLRLAMWFHQHPSTPG